MKTIGLIALVVSLSLLIQGCSTLGPPLAGYIVTNVSYPHVQAVADDGKVGNKTGTATAVNILGLFAFGDASVLEAAKNGGITNIKTIDHTATSFIFFGSFSTTVTGE